MVARRLAIVSMTLAAVPASMGVAAASPSAPAVASKSPASNLSRRLLAVDVHCRQDHNITGILGNSNPVDNWMRTFQDIECTQAVNAIEGKTEAYKNGGLVNQLTITSGTLNSSFTLKTGNKWYCNTICNGNYILKGTARYYPKPAQTIISDPANPGTTLTCTNETAPALHLKCVSAAAFSF